MARDWYWLARIQRTESTDAETLPMRVTLETGCPPFLGARELDDALEFAFEPEAAPEAIAAAVARAAGISEGEVSLDKVPTRPWLEDYWKRLRPLEIGDKFLILPRAELNPEAGGRIPLRLEPGMAFGTGDHFTTGYCLSRLEAAARDHPLDAPLLDLGTGSGLLALGANKLGFTAVEAVDVDPLAIEEAAANFARNGVPDGAIKLQRGSIHGCAGPYRVIVANLFADLLRAIEPDLRARVAPRGRLILSGISAENWPRVEAGFTPANWTMTDRAEGDGWVGVSYRRA